MKKSSVVKHSAKMTRQKRRSREKYNPATEEKVAFQSEKKRVEEDTRGKETERSKSISPPKANSLKVRRRN